MKRWLFLLLLPLLLSKQSKAAIAVVQDVGKDCGSVASCTLPQAHAPTAGNLQIVFVRVGGSPSAASVTDTLGNAYALAMSCRQAGDPHSDFIYWAVEKSTGANTVSVSAVGGTVLRFEATEISGLVGPSLGQSLCLTGTGTAASAGSVSPPVGALVINMASTAGVQTYTSSAGFTRLGGVAGKFATQYQIAAGPSTPSFSLSGADKWASTTLTFLGQTPPPPPPVDTTPPTIQITSPAPNTTISGLVSASATAGDNVAVANVQFTVDGVVIGGQQTTPPFVVTLDTALLAPGPHTLGATATDTSNNTTSVVEQITVAGELFDITVQYDDGTPYAPNGTLSISELLPNAIWQNDLVANVSPVGAIKFRWSAVAGTVYTVVLQDAAKNVLWQTGTELTPAQVPTVFQGVAATFLFSKATGAWLGLSALRVNY